MNHNNIRYIPIEKNNASNRSAKSEYTFLRLTVSEM